MARSVERRAVSACKFMQKLFVLRRRLTYVRENLLLGLDRQIQDCSFGRRSEAGLRGCDSICRLHGWRFIGRAQWLQSHDA
jgi:hypothetical protein